MNSKYYPIITLLTTAALAAITVTLLFNSFFFMGILTALATISFEVWKFTVGRIR